MPRGWTHHLTKPLEVDLLWADCTRLGLLPRDAAPPSEAGRQLGIDTPLLDPYVFVQTLSCDRQIACERRIAAHAAAAFVAAATLRLPE